MSAPEPACGGDLSAAGVAAVRRALASAAGGFLHNPIRDPALTCAICTAPVDRFDRCWRCRHDARLGRLADLVVPLTYAIAGQPSAALVRDYKNHPLRRVRDPHRAIISSLLRLGITGHERCVAAAVGQPVSLRVVVPSLTSRPGPHPLAEIARAMGVLGEAELLPTWEASPDRQVCADKFGAQPAGAVAGRHVLVLDDVWTTGSNAQSAALTLRAAGAAAVSVMVVGRWLSRDYRVTADFIATRLTSPFDPGCCPVTGGRCP
jgi:hypothetical protein